MTADIVGDDRLTEPDWTDTQGWRYALPEEGVSDGLLDSGASHDLYFLGDWVAGEGRLHAAMRSGLDTGQRLANRL
jgi:predicted NAD/FAD-dependent oxidoreductase